MYLKIMISDVESIFNKEKKVVILILNYIVESQETVQPLQLRIFCSKVKII